MIADRILNRILAVSIPTIIGGLLVACVVFLFHDWKMSSALAGWVFGVAMIWLAATRISTESHE